MFLAKGEPILFEWRFHDTILINNDFQSNIIKPNQVFVAEGEPAMFECRVEPKHDLNLSVRWYRNDEELVSCDFHFHFFFNFNFRLK